MAMEGHSDTKPGTALKVQPCSEGRRCWSDQLDWLLLGCVDTGLAAVVFSVPLILGGRIALGQFVLVVLALWVGVCWCLRQSLAPQSAWIRCSAELLLLAALALVGLQLAALPPSVLKVLSPHVYETLPLWAPDGEAPAAMGVWTTLSLTPAATRNALVLLLAFVLLFLVTVQRVRQVEDAERLLRWIAGSTVVMAILALAQYLAGNGKFFWFFEHPQANTHRFVQGSFTNRNHFAHFIALGVGPLIWWVQDGLRCKFRRDPARPTQFGPDTREHDVKVGLRTVALGFCVFVALLSLSRGGAMAVFIAAMVAALILYRSSLVKRKTLLALAGVGLLVGASLFVHGYKSVAARLDDFGSIEDLDSRQARRQIWKADAAAIADFPLTGTGMGSHTEVCPTYLPDRRHSQGIEFTHAENGYVQVGQETGAAGLLLALIAVCLCAYWCVSSLRRGVSTRILLCVAAVASSLAASFAHSMADFVWYVPGCMVAVVILAACACRLRQLAGNRADKSTPGPAISRYGWLAALSCLILIGYFMVQNRLAAVRAEPFWHRYLRLSNSFAGLDGVDRYNALRSMAGELSAVVARQPDHARAHTRLADIHLKLFDHQQDPKVTPLGVRQVREAVVSAGFQSSEAMSAWLSRAFGRRRDHLDAAMRHARRAVTLCPLQGEAYLYLADLSFLEGPKSPGKAAYVEQALRVRPFDGAILFAAGQEAVLAGDLDQALMHWRASFRAGPVHQNRLLKLLAVQVPASFVLDTFQPDPPAMKRIATHYRGANRPEDLRYVLTRYAGECESRAGSKQGKPAADSWLDAAKAHKELNNLQESLKCLRSAVSCDFSHYQAHYALGKCLHELKEFGEAEKHLTWCLRRKPRDKKLRALAAAAIDGRLRSVRTASNRRSQRQFPQTENR